MSQRERQPVRLGTARPANGPGPPRPPSTSPADRPGAWEEFFRSASPDQQAELLAQARRQEILYTHQLRHTTNGAAPERAGQILSLLRGGKASCLEPVRPAATALVDSALDEMQRDAVGKALATPDLCLIQGLPGTGKSRVVAELVTQAALRGEHILLVAPTPEAVDRVLEQVADREAIFAVRCVGRDERGEDLAPALQSLTFERRLCHLTDLAIPEARRAVEALTQSSQKLAHSEAVFGRCLELADAAGKLSVDVTTAEKELAEATAVIDGEVQRLEAGDRAVSPLTEAFQVRSRAFAQVDAALADLRRRADDCRLRLEQHAPQRLSLLPLVEAKRNGRWWTASWWRARFAGDVLAKWEAIESVSRWLADEQGAIDQHTQRLAQERDQADQAYQAERQRHVAFEVARRQAVLDERLSALRSESAVVAEKWQRAVHELEPTTRPIIGNADQVRSLQEECRRQQQSLNDRAALAREWLECLTAQAGHFPVWLEGRANLVAATNLTLASDAHFGGATNFDLLIIEEAHRLTEAEFVQLARRARRWVLVGETERTGSCGAEPDEAPARKGRPAAGLRLPSPRLFAELWRQLHCDPRRLPSAWLQEDARLCCRLRDLSAEDRRWLETEHVADFPEIELRILALPRQKPLLAEVIFPPTMSMVQAKEYIFRELQELPVRALGHSYRWCEEPDRLVLRLSDSPVSKPLPVALQNGVREMVGQVGPEANGVRPGHTCCLEFDRSAGWDQARAEDWVQRHLGVRDPGRTVQLDVPHRMQDPALAAFLSELLYAGGYRPVKSAANGAAGENGHAAPVEFVSVPSAAADLAPRRAENGKRNAGVSRPRATRTGAGLELDMAEPSHRSRLPADLRGGMPDRGIVNLLEAQAVVRYLEGLAAAGSTASVGVMALYPAQVALIRTLVRQSTRLGGLDLRVGEPSAFRERECGVVLLSLTRSHHHRAVTYGEGPQLLGLALTRARRKLVLFGDPGTLARRREWDGPVDHLDDGAAAWERDLVARLLRQFDGATSRPAAPIPEGSHA